jgi:hypothetical protein
MQLSAAHFSFLFHHIMHAALVDVGRCEGQHACELAKGCKAATCVDDERATAWWRIRAISER